jgi:hypothetical protein
MRSPGGLTGTGFKTIGLVPAYFTIGGAQSAKVTRISGKTATTVTFATDVLAEGDTFTIQAKISAFSPDASDASNTVTFTAGAPTIAVAAQPAVGATRVRITGTHFKTTGLALADFTIGGAQSAKVTGISGTPTTTAVTFATSALAAEDTFTIQAKTSAFSPDAIAVSNTVIVVAGSTGLPPDPVVPYTDNARHFTITPGDNITGDTITIRWNAAARATSYRLSYKKGEGTVNVYLVIGTGDVGTTTLTTLNHTGLEQGTVYQYSIVAINDYGESEKTDLAITITPVTRIPRNVTQEGAEVSAWGGPTIYVNWEYPGGATKYRVYYTIGGRSAAGPFILCTFYPYVGEPFTEMTGGGHYHGAGYDVANATYHYLNTDTTYSYYVEAGNTWGWSDISQGYIGTATTNDGSYISGD